MLRGLDALVFDIQDIGARFYTYESTMLYAMEEAAKVKLPYYVLDRPNPITGIHVEGPMLDPDKLSFTGSFPLPLRHGLTIGELAGLINAGKDPRADLHVIEMTDWHREDWFDATGPALGESLPEYPQPQRSAALPRNCDAGVFHQLFGRPRDGRSLRADRRGLDSRKRPRPALERPEYSRCKNCTDSIHAGFVEFQREKRSTGVRFTVTNRTTCFHRHSLGLAVAATLQLLYPKKIMLDVDRNLIGSSAVIERAGNATRIPCAAANAEPWDIYGVTPEIPALSLIAQLAGAKRACVPTL